MPTTMSTRTMTASRCSRCHRKVPKRKAMPAKRDPIRNRMMLQPSNSTIRCKLPCQRRLQRQRRQQTLWPAVHRLATSPEVQVVCRCWQTTTMFGQTLLTDSCLGIVVRAKINNQHRQLRQPQRQCTVPSVKVLTLLRMVQVNRTNCIEGDYFSKLSSCSTVRRTTVHLAR